MGPLISTGSGALADGGMGCWPGTAGGGTLAIPIDTNPKSSNG